MSDNYRGPGIYKHYKGGFYKVIGLAVREETLAKPDDVVQLGNVGGVSKSPQGVTVVVYEPLSPGSLLDEREESMWTRTLADFNARVPLWPKARADDGTTPRFTLIRRLPSLCVARRGGEAEALLEPLTEEQRRIADLLFHGASMEEIALVVDKSKSTVTTTASRIRARLEVGSNEEMLALYWISRLRDQTTSETRS